MCKFPIFSSVFFLVILIGCDNSLQDFHYKYSTKKSTSTLIKTPFPKSTYLDAEKEYLKKKNAIEELVANEFATKGLHISSEDLDKYSKNIQHTLNATKLNSKYWICEQKISALKCPTTVNGSRLFLFDNNLNIKDEDFVSGCHSHVGNYSVQDWDKDGENEVIHFLHFVDKENNLNTFDWYTVFELNQEQMIPIIDFKDSLIVYNSTSQSISFETVTLFPSPLKLELKHNKYSILNDSTSKKAEYKALYTRTKINDPFQENN